MPAYLDTAGFKDLSLMPSAQIDQLVEENPGWLEAQLEQWSARIDARLRKQYAVPFSDPYPDTVKGWLASVVTKRCYIKRGVDPNDRDVETINAEADEAWAEIREAADSQNGLFDLPLRADTNASGIAAQQTRAYAEQGPFVGFSKQAEIGRQEDANGDGTYV